MNLIYDTYPDTVLLHGVKREIVTDFKDWLRFVDMLKDTELSDQLKLESMLQFYFDDLPLSDRPNAHKPLVDFFSMKDANEETEAADAPRTSKPLYDFCIDARYIMTGFWQDYRIDLTETDMHWWKFRILLDGLSEKTEFKQRVMYRNTNAGEIKDASERSRILKIQRSIALPQTQPDEFEIGGMFW